MRMRDVWHIAMAKGRLRSGGGTTEENGIDISLHCIIAYLSKKTLSDCCRLIQRHAQRPRLWYGGQYLSYLIPWPLSQPRTHYSPHLFCQLHVAPFQRQHSQRGLQSRFVNFAHFFH